jgi:hypothetical protein
MNPSSCRSVRNLLCPLLALALPGALGASTVAPPRDLGELLRISAAVVLAEAGSSWGEPGPVAPYTATRFYALEQVAGRPVPATFEVWELGGEAGGTRVVLSGWPEFVPGRRYLLFLDFDQHGRWRPRMLAYGLLEESPDGRLLRPLPEMRDIGLMTAGRQTFEPVEVYRRDALLEHLRAVGRGAPWQRSAVLATGATGATGRDVETATPPAECVFLASSGTPFRWFGFETAATTATIFATTPGQTGIGDGGASAVEDGAAAWADHSDSLITYSYGGTRAVSITCTGSAFPDNDPGGVVFNDPCGDVTDLSGCSGTLARGGALGGLASSYDGDSWFTISAPFVLVNNGSQCLSASSFAEMMTHELGHSLGFGHHAVAAPPSNPTMSSSLKGDGRGAALVGADKTCASFAYHTFLDVPTSSSTWKWIEAIENAGVTAGCGSGNFCPASSVTREQMAVFLLRAKEGPSYTPPACAVPTFLDVLCSSPFSPWINELAARGITGGCGGGNYCPLSTVTRAQMAVFLLATLEGPGYSPPACTVPTFGDVPCSHPFAAWINELAARGITGGCGGGSYCPGSSVTRAQMAVFLSATFSLPTP